MEKPFIKVVLAAAFGLALCFAQDAPPKLAVYVSGAADAGINKSLSSKLLMVMTQGGEYAEIADPGSFHDELVKSGKNDIVFVSQAANRHSANYVCFVSMIEVFGAYSITARLARASDSYVVKTGQTDHTLKSMEDLTIVSNELARQLLPTATVSAPVAATTPPPVSAFLPTFNSSQQETAQVPMGQKRCAKTYNVNELLFNIKSGFPNQLKDCSSTLAKDMLTPASFGGRKLEPVSFMKQCPIDGIKKELPDGFPNADKILNSMTNFVNGLLNAATAGAALDPKKLINAVGSMDINGLLGELKGLSANECVVDEPYFPPVAQQPDNGDISENKNEEGKKSVVSFGIRAGMNFSHTYAEYERFNPYDDGSGVYNDILGMQVGFVLDIAATDWFHIQPGLMYIQKGMNDDHSNYTSHNLEIPILLSLKLAVLRLNVGPYIGICMDGESFSGCGGDTDLGISMGFGFDIGMFYIGAFYDYGLSGATGDFGNSTRGLYDITSYNRTLGLNLGVNL